MRLRYALALLALLALLAVAPIAVGAQAPRTIVRYGFADGALEISVRTGALIAIAGAHGDSAATVVVRAAAARAWGDSTRRMTRRAAPRKRSVIVSQRSMIAEAADSGAAISFVRRAAADTTTFQLVFSTRASGGFPLTLERREANLFFAAIRRAVDVALPPRGATPTTKAKATP